jgi:hypothetical protein
LGVLRESARRKKKTIGAKRMVETPSVADVRNIQVCKKLLLTNDKKISPCSPGCVDMRDSVGESGSKAVGQRGYAEQDRDSQPKLTSLVEK